MRIVITGDKTGTPPLDGEYPIPAFDDFNGDQLHLVKSVSGVRLNEFEEAAAAGDWDLVVAFAAIALALHDGRSYTATLPRLRKLTVKQIELAEDKRDEEREQEREEEDGPPAPPSAPPPTLSALGSASSTGESGPSDSEPSPASDPSPTGAGGSENSSASDRETSAA